MTDESRCQRREPRLPPGPIFNRFYEGFRFLIFPKCFKLLRHLFGNVPSCIRQKMNFEGKLKICKTLMCTLMIDSEDEWYEAKTCRILLLVYRDNVYALGINYKHRDTYPLTESKSSDAIWKSLNLPGGIRSLLYIFKRCKKIFKYHILTLAINRQQLHDKIYKTLIYKFMIDSKGE